MKTKEVTSENCSIIFDEEKKQLVGDVAQQAAAWNVICRFLDERGLGEFEIATPYTGIKRTIRFLETKFS